PHRARAEALSAELARPGAEGKPARGPAASQEVDPDPPPEVPLSPTKGSPRSSPETGSSE
ncbi:MAG: hypothetical protein D6731_09115, partial [Planctomycetota bacterium]